MIEIGKKYEIVNSLAANNGRVVTVIGHEGPEHFPEIADFKPRWIVNAWRLTNRENFEVNHLQEDQLKPISESDHDQPISWDDMEGIWVPAREG